MESVSVVSIRQDHHMRWLPGATHPNRHRLPFGARKHIFVLPKRAVPNGTRRTTETGTSRAE